MGYFNFQALVQVCYPSIGLSHLPLSNMDMVKIIMQLVADLSPHSDTGPNTPCRVASQAIDSLETSRIAKDPPPWELIELDNEDGRSSEIGS